MIGHVSTRRDFARLQGTTRRARSGALSVSVVPEPDGSPSRVAFAIGRDVGSAVVRNRLRRRLRHVVAHLDRGDELEPALYLLRARRGLVEVGFEQLVTEVRTLVVAAR